MSSETSKLYLDHLLTSALSELKFASELPNPVEILVPDQKFGDYSTNLALALGKKLKVSPKEIADKIITSAKRLDTEQMFSEITAVNGFINFRISPGSLAKYVRKTAGELSIEQTGLNASGRPKKVVFEYSSPNTNKPLHIGHTRNDVYGKACINLLKALGYNVVSCEIINDRGIHIMKSVLMYMKYGEGLTPETESDLRYKKSDHFVGKFYQMFAAQAAKSEDSEKHLLAEARELLQKWEAGDKQVRAVWQKMNSWFYEGVKKTYGREGSDFDEVDFESQIYHKGREVVLAAVKSRSEVFKKSDVDQSVFFIYQENDKQEKKYLVRADGTTIYITQDIYLWNQRDGKHHPDLTIVTTAAEQSYHFKVLKKVFEALGYPWAGTFKHLPYEHVFLGHDKMSSREGNSISADELLETIKQKVKTAMSGLQKIKQSSDNDELVEQVAFGAIKFGYLKYEPNTRMYFDPDQTISLHGQTGPYVQYAYSRMRSIIKKAGEVRLSTPDQLTGPSELGLMRSLIHYSEAVVSAAADYKPNLLCNYLYELAAAGNTFYNDVRVIDAENSTLKHQRLTLLTAVANVLKRGLNLLGIQAPEEM